MGLPRHGRDLRVFSDLQWVVGFDSDMRDEETVWSLHINPEQTPKTLGTTNGGTLTYQVTYVIGEMTYTGPETSLPDTGVHEFFISARKVTVNFRAPVGFVNGKPAYYIVHVGGAPNSHGFKGPQGSFPTPAQVPSAPASMSDHGALVPITQKGPFKLHEISIDVFAMPNGVNVVWLLLFDDNTAGLPAANAVPVRGGRSPALGLNSSVSGQAAFEPLRFDVGIKYALSAQPDVYVQPAAGGQVTVDWVGSAESQLGA